MRSVLLLTALLVTTLVTGVAFADNNKEASCRIANVAGTYGYVGFGVVRAPNPFLIPAGTWSSIGTLQLDGKGNITITDTARVDDIFFPPNTVYTGTYTVETNCVCNMTIAAFTALGIPGPHFKAVLVENRSKLVSIFLLPGITVHFVNTTKL